MDFYLLARESSQQGKDEIRRGLNKVILFTFSPAHRTGYYWTVIKGILKEGMFGTNAFYSLFLYSYVVRAS